MAFSLSKYSIHKQILIGYIPVLVVLIFLAFSSFEKFQNFNNSFEKLKETNRENMVFLEVERDVIELQRNVVVYSYVGYQGVLRKITFLQKRLKDKFGTVRTIVQDDSEIKARFDRMVSHYRDYNDGFQDAVNERKTLKDIKNQELLPLYEKQKNILDVLEAEIEADQNYEALLSIGKVKGDLINIHNKIDTFASFPDAVLISETYDLIKDMRSHIVILEKILDSENTQKSLGLFSEHLEQYEKSFKKTVRVSRTYIHLINVVLAGKAAEINQLSNELNGLIKERSGVLSDDIRANIQRSQNQFFFLVLIASLIGFVSSGIIARGISKPVSAMASTLSRLVTGNIDIDIPGQNRKDEVGKMARAANEFRVMALDLEAKTIELEEFAYRTSHDLRSPLVSSIGVLGVVQDAVDNDEKDKAEKGIALVTSSLHKLETLVKDILTMTETKHVEEPDQIVDLKSIVEEVLEKLSHMDNFDRLKIETDFQYQDTFHCKKSRVTLILENLISNAIKYQDTQKDVSIIKILTYKDDNDSINCVVQDNGLGIPKNQQEQIFTMFKRFHPKVSFGSGLGLYMVKKSADIIKGNVQYKNMDAGSEFKLTIPM